MPDTILFTMNPILPLRKQAERSSSWLFEPGTAYFPGPGFFYFRFSTCLHIRNTWEHLNYTMLRPHARLKIYKVAFGHLPLSYFPWFWCTVRAKNRRPTAFCFSSWWGTYLFLTFSPALAEELSSPTFCHFTKVAKKNLRRSKVFSARMW